MTSIGNSFPWLFRSIFRMLTRKRSKCTKAIIRYEMHTITQSNELKMFNIYHNNLARDSIFKGIFQYISQLLEYIIHSSQPLAKLIILESRDNFVSSLSSWYSGISCKVKYGQMRLFIVFLKLFSCSRKGQ